MSNCLSHFCCWKIKQPLMRFYTHNWSDLREVGLFKSVLWDWICVTVNANVKNEMICRIIKSKSLCPWILHYFTLLIIIPWSLMALFSAIKMFAKASFTITTAVFFYIACACGSVVEHCISSAKGCGFNSQILTYWQYMYNLNAL